MSWALEGGLIEKLDKDEELDFLEMRLQKLESKEFIVRRKAAEALSPYISENRYIDEVRERFRYQPPHPAAVLAEGILNPHTSDKKTCMSGAQSLAVMGPAAAPHASKSLAYLMTHPDDELRWQAARALGYLGPGAAAEAAAAMGLRLDHDTEQNNLVRFVTAKSLGFMGPAAAEYAASALAMALKDRDADVQNASAAALEKMGAAAAPYAAKKLVQAMMEGTLETRRLAIKALSAMGESCADVAAYPISRVMLAMQPCCREYFHGLRPLRQEPPSTCNQCGATGPFAEGTDFICVKGCDFKICKRCWCHLKVHDVQMQRLAAEALPLLGIEAVKICQVYLARALGDPDEGVREKARKALKMAECQRALGGSMALFNKEPSPCGQVDCRFCTQEVGMLADEPSSTLENDDDEEVDDTGELATEAEVDEAGEPAPEAEVPSSALESHDDAEINEAGKLEPVAEEDCEEDPVAHEKGHVEVMGKEEVNASAPATERSADEKEEEVARAEDYIKTPPNEEAKDGLFEEARKLLLVAGFDGRLSSHEISGKESNPEEATPKRQRLRDPWGPPPRNEDGHEKRSNDDDERSSFASST